MTPSPPAPRSRRLRRRDISEMGGVAGGFADYLGVGTKPIRIGIVVLMLIFGLEAVAVYLAAWLMIPKANDPSDRPIAFASNSRAVVAGFVLLGFVLAGAFSGTRLIAGGDDPGAVFATGVMLAGLWLLVRRKDPTLDFRPDPAYPNPADPTWPGPANPYGPTTAMGSPPASTNPRVEPGPSEVDFAPSPSWIPEPALPDISLPEMAPPDVIFPPIETRVPGWAVPHVEPTTKRTGSRVTSITLAAGAVAVGLVLTLDAIWDIDNSATITLGAIVALIGLGIVASSIFERALWLLPLALVSIGMLFVSPLIDGAMQGGFGVRNLKVSDTQVLQATYALGAGEINLDLRDLDLAGEATTVEVQVGAGVAQIIVPDDVVVRVVANNRAGTINVDGLTDEGIVNHIDHQFGTPQGPDAGSLTIEVDVTFGEIGVHHG